MLEFDLSSYKIYANKSPSILTFVEKMSKVLAHPNRYTVQFWTEPRWIILVHDRLLDDQFLLECHAESIVQMDPTLTVISDYF